MKDIDEEIPVSKASKVPPPVSSIRTRKMRKEDAKKVEQDKISPLIQEEQGEHQKPSYKKTSLNPMHLY